MMRFIGVYKLHIDSSDTSRWKTVLHSNTVLLKRV